MLLPLLLNNQVAAAVAVVTQRMNPRLSPLFIWYDDSDNSIISAPAGTGIGVLPDCFGLINIEFTLLGDLTFDLTGTDPTGKVGCILYIDRGKNCILDR